MKKFILTEDEKKSIRKLYYLNEQYAAIEALFGKNLAKTASTNMSDDIVRELEKKSAKILQNSKVITQEGGQLFLLSASGAKVSAKTLSDALDAVMTGKLPKSAVINYFPRQLADGTEFRSFFDSALMNLKSRGGASATASAVSKVKGPLQSKWSTNPENYRSLISSMEQKLSKLKNFKFKGKEDLNVVGSEKISGREVLEVKLPTNDTVLIYRSSGSNVGSTGKNAGEWFVIPGFSNKSWNELPDGWFIKTEESINLTKGGNQYMTDMSNWLFKNWAK